LTSPSFVKVGNIFSYLSGFSDGEVLMWTISQQLKKSGQAGSSIFCITNLELATETVLATSFPIAEVLVNIF